MLTYQNYEMHFEELIGRYENFDIVDVEISDMLDVCSMLEEYIESKYLTCRIYTKNRMAGGLLGVFNPFYGMVSLAAIAAHNIMTSNPDYEISRDLVNKRIEVRYCN